MRTLRTACAGAVTLVLMLASAAPAAAQAEVYSDTHAGVTLEGRFINDNGTCNGYPKYLPGGSVDVRLVISSDHMGRPLPWAFNVEMWDLTLGEHLGYTFPDPPTVPAGERVEFEVSFGVPPDAEGLYALSVHLGPMPDKARPQGKAPPFVWLNMIFCTPGT